MKTIELTVRNQKRIFTLTLAQNGDEFKAHLIKRGFTGEVFNAYSAPIGKQRKSFNTLIVQSKYGHFEFLI